MKPLRILSACLLAAAGFVGGAGSAWAGHSHVSIGFSFGGPVYGHYGYGPRHYGPRYYGPHFHAYPRYYGPSYYNAYYPAPVYVAPVVVSPPVVMQPQQQVYIEQPRQSAGAGQIQPQENSPYWYFCAERNAYYPYVKTCAGGWQQVTPTPQDQ